MNKFIFITIIVVLFLGLIGGLIGGHIDYNFEQRKCGSMTSEVSSYDFDHKVELDAEFSQHCFWIKTHPLAYATNLFCGGLLGFLIAVVLSLIIFFAGVMFEDCFY